MIQTIYVERDLLSHPRVERICARLPRATVVECERYGEVFNRRRQNFRLQKRSPSLILAAKHEVSMHPTPAGYGVGGARNFYFAHMLNCPYDCRYCFLQGMFSSAHYVVFVNFEDFFSSMAAVTRESAAQPSWFFSGYDCDSLAFEGITGFAAETLEFLGSEDGLRLEQARVELRTKSVAIGALTERTADERVVVAYSLSPAPIAQEHEHGAPSIERRLAAISRLQVLGWRIGLRFDPLLLEPDAVRTYRELFEQVFSSIDASALHSVSLGVFRLPRSFHRRLTHLYPEEPLFAVPTEDRGGLISYPRALERDLFADIEEELLQFVDRDIYFPCLSGDSPLDG